MHLDAAEDPYPLLLDASLKKSLEETLGVGCIIQHRSLCVAWVTAVCDQHQYLSHNETILPIPGDQNEGKVSQAGDLHTRHNAVRPLEINPCGVNAG